MAQMSMNRVIHGAIRRDLRRFESALAGFHDDDHERARSLHTAWLNFHAQLTRHHEGEHDIAWPALVEVGVEPETLATMDSEHGVMVDALEAVAGAMATLASSAASRDAEAALFAVRRLREVTERHLDHEEEVLEPTYLSQRDTPAIKQMGRQFGRVGPATGGLFFAWLTDGASQEELTALRAEVPAPVLRLIGGIFGRRYRRDVATVWR